MKNSLKYKSSVMCIIIAIELVLLPIMVDNIFLVMLFTWCVNALSISVLGNSGNFVYKMDRHDESTLSLPLPKKTIYDKRMLLTGALYFVGIFLTTFACIPYGLYVYYFCVVILFMFGHIMCALCIRKPYLQIISGIPAFILLIKRLMYDRQDFGNFLFSIEHMRLRVCLGIICSMMLAIDIFVWLRERKIFIDGNSKGSDLSKEDKKILIIFFIFICIVVITCFALYIKKNNSITDEERILQSHSDQLNNFFEEYGIRDLSDSRLDPLEIVLFCDFDRNGIGDEIVKTAKLLFDDYIGENGEFIYRKEILIYYFPLEQRDPEHCLFEIDEDGVNVYLYTDAINLSTIADVFPDINTMTLGDTNVYYLNPMWTEADFSNFQSIREINYYGNWIVNEDVDKVRRKYPYCHVEHRN